MGSHAYIYEIVESFRNIIYCRLHGNGYFLSSKAHTLKSVSLLRDTEIFQPLNTFHIEGRMVVCFAKELVGCEGERCSPSPSEGGFAVGDDIITNGENREPIFNGKVMIVEAFRVSKSIRK